MRVEYTSPYKGVANQNQPTVLTRRACEVALGIRKRAYKPQASFEPKKECTGSVDPPEERKKPDPAPKNKNAKSTFHKLIPCFPAQCYKCDSCQYGPCSSPPCQTCSSPPCQPYRSPECQYEDCVFAKAVLPPKASCFDCPSYFY